MRHSACGRLAASMLLFIPLLAAAGINKCTDAAGVVTYSDQPCAIQGQKPVEARDATAFSMLEARENDKKIAQSCKQLTNRRGGCYRIDSRLETALRTNCAGPMQREQARQLEQRRDRYRRNQPAYEEMQEESRHLAETDCRALEANVYTFLRENFRNVFTPDEIKALEYHLNAVPSNGRPTFATRNRNERR
ncbi:MAG TPA: DUF4124 domain-containing protein [Noviherbaspirillum sp.]